MQANASVASLWHIQHSIWTFMLVDISFELHDIAKTFWTTIENDYNNNNDNNNDTLLSTFTIPSHCVCIMFCVKKSNYQNGIVVLYCVGWRLYARDVKCIVLHVCIHAHSLYIFTFNVNCNVILTRCHDLTLNNVSILSLLTLSTSSSFPKSNRKIDFHNICISMYHIHTCTHMHKPYMSGQNVKGGDDDDAGGMYSCLVCIRCIDGLYGNNNKLI